MGIKIEYNGDYVHIIPDKEIEVYNIAEIKETIFEILERGNKKIIINLEMVEYIDSSGLGVLVTVLKRVRNLEGKLILLNPKSAVKQILGLTNLDKVFSIEENMESAVESLGR